MKQLKLSFKQKKQRRKLHRNNMKLNRGHRKQHVQLHQCQVIKIGLIHKIKILNQLWNHNKFQMMVDMHHGKLLITINNRYSKNQQVLFKHKVPTQLQHQDMLRPIQNKKLLITRSFSIMKNLLTIKWPVLLELLSTSKRRSQVKTQQLCSMLQLRWILTWQINMQHFWLAIIKQYLFLLLLHHQLQLPKKLIILHMQTTQLTNRNKKLLK